MVRSIEILLVVFLLSGCASAPIKFHSTKFYSESPYDSGYDFSYGSDNSCVSAQVLRNHRHIESCDCSDLSRKKAEEQAGCDGKDHCMYACLADQCEQKIVWEDE